MTVTGKHYVCAIVGVYVDCGQAYSALGELQRAGIAPGDISLVGTEDDIRQAQQGTFNLPLQVLRGEEHKGVVLGAGIGAATSLLPSAFAFLIPGLGTALALGALAGMLFGAGIGALTGGPLGVLNYHDEAIAYRELLQEGNVFVIVHCATTEEEQEARAELNKTQPRQLHIIPYAG